MLRLAALHGSAFKAVTTTGIQINFKKMEFFFKQNLS